MSLIAITMMGYLPFQADTPKAPMLWWPEAANGVCANGVHTSYQRGVGLLDSESVMVRWETPIPEYYCIGTVGYGGGAVWDIDNDGIPEIVVALNSADCGPSHGGVLVLDGPTGAVEWLWTTDGLLMDGFTPAIADLDGDGHPEIIAVNQRYDWPDGIPCVRVFALDGVTRQVDWTKDLVGDSAHSDATGYNPSIADADGDGKPEVLMSADLVQNSVWSLWCLNGEDGSVVWKKDSIRALLPVCGDVNGDGIKEVIAYGWFRWGIAWRKAVHALSGTDGSVVWRADTNIALHIPTITDIDGDGEMEVVGIGLYQNDGPRIICLNGKTGLTEWIYTPAKRCYPDNYLPTIGQMDSDPAQEDVTWFWGWTVHWVDGATGGVQGTYFRDSSKLGGFVIADIDNDGENEVIGGLMRLLRYRGIVCLKGTWPYGEEWFLPLTDWVMWVPVPYPIVADVDGDGYLEIVLIPGAGASWSNGATIRVLDNEQALMVKEEKALRPPSMLALPGKIVLSLLDPCPVELSLYDMSGRRVQVLYKGPLPAGTHEFEIGGLEPGVYLAELRYDGRITAKALAIRR